MMRASRNIFTQYLRHVRRYVNNWDLVDGSAPQIVGGYLLEAGTDDWAARLGRQLSRLAEVRADYPVGGWTVDLCVGEVGLICRVHPDGPAIYERSVAASEQMSELASARTPVLLAPGASEDLHSQVRETMSRIDPQAFCIGAEAVWLADQRDRVA